MLNGLMGQIRVSDCAEDYPVIPGARVKFGFNTGFASANPNAYLSRVENEGLLYDAEWLEVSGWLNPYVSIEGYANKYFDSSCDFVYTIWLTLKDYGLAIKPETIQGFVEQIDPVSGQSQGIPATTIPPPGQPIVLPSIPNLPNVPGGIPDVLPDLSCASKDGLDWIACELGVTRTTGVFIGVSLGLLAFVLLKR